MATPTATRLREETFLASLRRAPLSGFERGCVALMGVGVALRLVAFQVKGLSWDVGWYVTMAVSLLRHGEFVVPWAGPDVYTQHYPPLYPALLALAFRLFGVSLDVMHAVSIAVFAFLVLVALLTTWDLYGRARGFAVAAAVAVFPTLVLYDAAGFTESLVCALFAITIWAVLRGLEDPRFVVLAGLFAALGYLTKASMGPFFIVAGLAGLAWRFHYARWSVFRDRHYLAGAAVFASGVLLWAWRNVARHGWPHWETQRHATDAFRYMFAQPDWPVVLAQEAVWSALVLAAFAAPFYGGIRRSLARVREEATSGLWLAVLTPSLVAVLFVTAFHMYEKAGAIANVVNLRYLITPLVPLMWLGWRDLDLAPAARPAGAPESGAREDRRATALAVAGVAVLALAFALDPTRVRLDLPSVLLLYGGVLLGCVLVALGVAFRRRVATRTVGSGRGAETRWRLVPDPTGPRAALALAALALVGLVVGFFWALPFLALFVAGAVAAAFRDGRAKVAAAVLVLLGAALAGGGSHEDGAAVAAEMAAAAPDGATVAVLHHREHFLWPFLPDSLTMVRPDAAPDFLVEVYPRNPERAPPEGYEPFSVHHGHGFRLPGTAALMWLQAALLDEPPAPRDLPFVVVYRATAADGPP